MPPKRTAPQPPSIEQREYINGYPNYDKLPDPYDLGNQPPFKFKWWDTRSNNPDLNNPFGAIYMNSATKKAQQAIDVWKNGKKQQLYVYEYIQEFLKQNPNKYIVETIMEEASDSDEEPTIITKYVLNKNIPVKTISKYNKEQQDIAEQIRKDAVIATQIEKVIRGEERGLELKVEESEDPEVDEFLSLYGEIESDPALSPSQQLVKQEREDIEKQFIEEGNAYPIQLDNLPPPEMLDDDLKWWSYKNFENTRERLDIPRTPQNKDILNSREAQNIKIKAWDKSKNEYVDLSPKEYMAIRERDYSRKYLSALFDLNKRAKQLEVKRIELEKEIATSKIPIKQNKKIMNTLPRFIEQVYKDMASLRDLEADNLFQQAYRQDKNLNSTRKNVSTLYQTLNNSANTFNSMLTAAPSAGRERLSNKEVLKILKTKSKPNIKGLKTEIFKILNS